jgi:hypothetical protein
MCVQDLRDAQLVSIGPRPECRCKKREIRGCTQAEIAASRLLRVLLSAGRYN